MRKEAFSPIFGAAQLDKCNPGIIGADIALNEVL
jgi:hypothetical protein